MSVYTTTNSTTGRSNTFENLFRPGNTVVPGYIQINPLSYDPVVNSGVEGTAITGYESGGVDIGTLFCPKISGFINSNNTVPVSNYSKCTIVMCGAGGGGGGGGRNPARGTGGTGGAGGITIVQNVPLEGVNNIVVVIGQGGQGGPAAQAPFGTNALPGFPGNETRVDIGATQYIANGGAGGDGAPITGPGTPGAPGNTTPSTQNFSDVILVSGLQYQKTNTKINVPTVGIFGPGGPGGTGGPTTGTLGGDGSNGYVRLYFYC